MSCDVTSDYFDAPESTLRPVRFGSYELHSELASGGTASVSIGMHRGAAGFEKVVAIKRLLPTFAFDPNYQAMLADEADVCARADHPFVRDVYDFGIGDDGSPYAVMEFLFGQPLAAVHRAMAAPQASPWPERDPRHAAIVARVVSQLCEGLHAVHELAQGDGPLEIVHRDVTPHNLFVLYDGSVRLTDLGILRARVRRQSPSCGAIKGKLPYMSPEYLCRRPYDRRSDVWSMGVVLWELVTGLRLFRKESDAVSLQAITSGTVPPASALAPDCDPHFDAIVARAVCRNVDQRYRSARELGDALEEWLTRGHHAVKAVDVEGWLDRSLPGARADLARVVHEVREGRAAARARSERPTLHPTSHSRPTTPAMSSLPHAVVR